MKHIKCPVIFEDREYYGIREFDGKVVSLYTEETLQGGFSTVIPISSTEYRLKNPTKARAVIRTEKDWTIFDIYADYGDLSTIKIHNSLSKEIEYATKKLIIKQLLNK